MGESQQVAESFISPSVSRPETLSQQQQLGDDGVDDFIIFHDISDLTSPTEQMFMVETEQSLPYSNMPFDSASAPSLFNRYERSVSTGTLDKLTNMVADVDLRNMRNFWASESQQQAQQQYTSVQPEEGQEGGLEGLLLATDQYPKGSSALTGIGMTESYCDSHSDGDGSLAWDSLYPSNMSVEAPNNQFSG